MQVRDLAISGIKLIVPRVFRDGRGWFQETYHARRYAEQGIDVTFVQDNLSWSAASGTIRGLHFQRPPNAQAKLVSVLRGRIFDVALDIRRGSPTFGRYVEVELTAEAGVQLFVPAGFAHGFCTLEDDTTVAYKASAFYSPEDDAGVRWDDPDAGIRWPVTGEPMMSEKDRVLPFLRDIGSPF